MESKQPRDDDPNHAGLGSSEYRAKLLTKLNCLMAVLEVAITKISRSMELPTANLDRLTKVFDPIVEGFIDKHTEHQYDALGNRTMMINNIGVKTKYVYDDIDRLLQTIEDFQGTDPSTQDTTSTYVYDGANQVTSLTDHDGNVTGYEYDLGGRANKIKHADNIPVGTGEVVLGYDAAGNLTTRTDQKAVTTTVGYAPAIPNLPRS